MLVLATPPPSGAAASHSARETMPENWSISKGTDFVSISSAPEVATAPKTRTDTNVPDAARKTTEQMIALERRRLRAHTPLVHQAWLALLVKSNLLKKYPAIHAYIREGFHIGFPSLSQTFTPPNSPSLYNHPSEFAHILQREFAAGRYLGPFTQLEVFSLIGHFQSSPLSMIPKPHKPGSFRLIQDFSFPHSASLPYRSINSFTNSDSFPCTWGTFNTIYMTVINLPPGSQAAIRDVAEAYRIIPLHPTQWNGAVVRISEQDSFVIDTATAFGASPNAGVFGGVADAAADLLRASGIGPISKWVDDHVFFRIPIEHIESYNQKRLAWRDEISNYGGKHVTGGRIWYGGAILSDGRVEEFDEDMAFPLKIVNRVPSTEKFEYPYNLADLDKVFDFLGIPWQKEKDQPFNENFVFTGFLWDIANKSVALTEAKRDKYRNAVIEWSKSRTHTLQEAEKLHAQAWESQSPWAHTGEHGSSGQDGTQRQETSDGRRPSVSNSSSGTSSRVERTQPPGISWSTVTIKEWERPGKEGEAETSKSTKSSDAPSISWNPGNPWSQSHTSVAVKTPQISHPGAFTHPSISSFPASNSPQPSNRISRISQQMTPNDSAGTATTRSADNSNSDSTPVPSSRNSSTTPQRRFNAPLPQEKPQGKPKPYPADLKLNPSPLRPHVCSRDRLRLWKPAACHANQALADVPGISLEDRERLERVNTYAFAEATLQMYGAGLLVYHIYCDMKLISEEDRAPAKAGLVQTFVSSLIGTYPGNTLKNYVAGIRAWHVIHSLPWAMKGKHLKLLYKSADKLAPDASKRTPRAPVIIKDLEKILALLDLSDPFDVATGSCATILIYAIARSGELTVPNLTAFDPTLHPQILNLSEEEDDEGHIAFQIWLPSTKRKPVDGEAISFAAQNTPTCPVAALRRHLNLNNPVAGEHLFSYSHYNPRKKVHERRPLTKTAFIDRINKAAKEAGLKPVHGHGFRIGGVLFYLLQGRPFQVVKEIGRWSSDTFTIYLRRHTAILSPYLQPDRMTRGEFPPMLISRSH
ncbi:hypothetical protein NLI96_g581 [Meripilus lineatus]|uniref:Tyr recombinase domain-containing protein n=1 Tax=Meripilus lineatus TaxID=2056292 RepID=A0AAD5VC50_9APHY|nr:hypothetical protein NLI96_g581 [Physisporinus lineatus]